jgi:CRISPR-associated protein Cas1
MTGRDADRPALKEPERAGPLRASSRSRVQLPEYLPARMLNEFVYCPRVFFYEWVEGVFAHSADTVEGALRHEKLDRKADALPEPDAPLGERIHSRSVSLSSDRYGLIATIDLVEGQGNVVVPVDYKRGRPRDDDEGPTAWPADKAQVCAQALILRDNGYQCDEAILYYDATKQRVRVPIDDALVRETLQALADARRLAASGRIPPPLVDSPKCPRCSLVTICLPDETVTSAAAAEAAAERQLTLFPLDDDAAIRGAVPAPPAVRRLVPARDDLRPLYVTGHGLSIGKTSEILRIKDRDGLVQEVRINEISHLNVFGNVQLTASALQGLCAADKPIAHLSFGGWFYGLTQGLGLKNVFLRRDQFRRADKPAFCLWVARCFVSSKIRNQRTLLQRNHEDPPRPILRRLRYLALEAARAEDMDALLGIEGAAARFYFEHFGGMIKVDAAERPQLDFLHRNRRPARDPVNALLSFAYSLLVKDLTIVCHAVGFDPFVGFYHQPRFGRPALALDLMEEFRPLVADSAVLTALNTKMVTPRDFIRVGLAVALTPGGRRALVRAYEQRMDTLVTHPLFGYRVNYRRVLEIQARLLARVVTGELAGYPGFETR